MRKNALVIGHAYIVPANRMIWSQLVKDHNVILDLVVPSKWNSNLIGEINFTKSSFDYVPNFDIHAIDCVMKGNGSFYFHNPFKLYTVLQRKKFDFIIINQEGWSLSLFIFNILNLFSKNRKCPVYLMIAQNIFKKKLWWAWPIEHFNMSFVKTSLGCCIETKDVLRAKHIKTTWRYFPLFFNGTIKKDQKKRILKSKPVFGYLGRLSKEKGLDTLLTAFMSVKKDFPSELHIAGDGPLKNMLGDSDINYLGLIPHDQVEDFYAGIDFLVVPSVTTKFWKEQFGRVIVEAIANGVMVIGSSSGAIPEVLDHLEIDFIFQEGDEKELEKLMILCMEQFSITHFQERLARAQTLCEEKFSTRAFNRRLMNYVES